MHLRTLMLIAALGLSASTLPAPAAGATGNADAPAPAAPAPMPAPPGAPPRESVPDAAALRSALDRLHAAGMPGVFAEVRDAGRTWRGASGVADLATGRPVTPGMRHRVGSITKTFVAVAVLQQAERGRLRLDDPVGDHLPDLVPGERGRRVTVRMLLNHTSGFAEYIPYAFPSLTGAEGPVSARSLDENRHRAFRPAELIALGLAAPPSAEPGALPGVYSNTNYVLLGQLLERTTGMPAEEYITRHVIRPAGLRNTGFPAGLRVEGAHSRLYEGLWGALERPRDYSTYDMSWAMAGAGLVSTMEDLNRFYGKLLAGEVITSASLAEMRRTVPVIALDGSTIEYGLGLHKVEVPGCGVFWGNEGSVWGAGTFTMTRDDGGRQMSVAINHMRWRSPHPIEGALKELKRTALGCAEDGHRS